MSSQKEAFITGLDHEDDMGMDDLVAPIDMREKVVKAPELEQVRKDHKKLMDVVRTFGEKVGGMVDKQRYEFMTAYEHHIQDIQNELQSLREKVAEISGEETRKAKLEDLDRNQTKFKAEALSLDTEALSQRKQLRKLVNTLHSVERDRDWVFKRLKVAKRQHQELRNKKEALLDSQRVSYENSVDRGGPAGQPQDLGHINSEAEASEYYQLMQEAGMDDLASIGSNSTAETGDLSIFINDNPRKNTAPKTQEEIRKKTHQIYGVHREQALLGVLPHIIPVSQQAASKNPINMESQKLLRASHAGGMNQSRSMPALGGHGQYDTSSPTKMAVKKSKEERDAIGELVALKARQEEIRDFVAQCASSCDRGPWAALPKRPIGELLNACKQVLSQMDEHERQWLRERGESSDMNASFDMMPDPFEEQRLLLAMELTAVPEVYFIIGDLLAGVDHIQEKQEAARAAQWSAAALSNSRVNTEEQQRREGGAGNIRVNNGNTDGTSGGQPETKDGGIEVNAASKHGMDNPNSSSSDADADDKGGIQISGWYEEGTARTAAGAPTADLGAYGAFSEAGKNVDLIGGNDISSWLAEGAAARAQARREELNATKRAAGETVEDDFMVFD